MSPLRPANGGFDVAWSEVFRDRFEGQPLKGVALTFGRVRVRGEAGHLGVLLNGKATRAYVCARCLKGNKVQKAV